MRAKDSDELIHEEDKDRGGDRRGREKSFC